MLIPKASACNTPNAVVLISIFLSLVSGGGVFFYLIGLHHRVRKNQKKNDLSHLEPLKTRSVSHCGLAIYIKKYVKAKEEELWKLKYFTIQKYNL
jgi:hypothetical protein